MEREWGHRRYGVCGARADSEAPKPTPPSKKSRWRWSRRLRRLLYPVLSCPAWVPSKQCHCQSQPASNEQN